jgi:hypothetical protein
MSESAKIRAVVDTNVFVSGLMGRVSPPRQIVDSWRGGLFVLVTSRYLVRELTAVLTYPKIVTRIHLKQSEMDAILALVFSALDAESEGLTLPGVTRDPKDDAVVACAVAGRADYIVSGDKDLLSLETYEGIEIVTPRQFLDIL